MLRAYCFAELGYPELAIGDAYKAKLLCEEGLAPDKTPLGLNVALCVGMEMWLLACSSPDYDSEFDVTGVTEAFLLEQQRYAFGLLYVQLGNIGCIVDALEGCQAAHALFPYEQLFADEMKGLAALTRKKLSLAQTSGMDSLQYLFSMRNGSTLAKPYPWMAEHHLRRSPSVIDAAKKDFEENYSFSRFGKPGPCALNQVNIGQVMPEDYPADPVQLGVFAAHDILAKEQILLDMTVAGGHSHKSQDMCDNCFGDFAYGKVPADCCSAIYCSPDCQEESEAYHPALCGKDFDWLYESARATDEGGDALGNLLFLRFLGLFVQSGNAHPLDHPLVARLKPQYFNNHRVIFTMAGSIEQPIQMLQQLGVDVFADPRYDTWVLRCIWARIMNNKRGYRPPGGGNIESINTLFSFFNHSCRPNTEWASDGSSSIGVYAIQDIKRGEELTLCYTHGIENLSFVERQVVLAPWLGGSCSCQRCNEERELEESSEEDEDEDEDDSDEDDKDEGFD